MRGTQAGTPYYGIYSPGTATEQLGFGAGWSDAGVIIPWTSWLQTGDTQGDRAELGGDGEVSAMPSTRTIPMACG